MRVWTLLLCLLLGLSGCGAQRQAAQERRPPDTAQASTPTAAPALEQTAASPPALQPSAAPTAGASACPLAAPLWVKPPEDSAVRDPPAFGYYYVNDDRSIWASAWWAGQSKYRLRASEDGVKVGWFRPAGADLVISGERIDGEAPPMDAHIPCCYPTRFQATGLIFPTEGCWEVTARAAGSELSFVGWVERS